MHPPVHTRSAAGLAALLMVAGGLTIVGCQGQSPGRSSAYAAPTAQARSVPTVAPALPVTLTPTPPCRNGATFLEDLSIPDGSTVAPGQLLEKRWSVQNSGTCDWGAGYRLVRIESGPIEGPAEIALYPARAGETALWQINLRAPEAAGEYLASWQARSPEGQRFGDQVYILIEVIPPQD